MRSTQLTKLQPGLDLFGCQHRAREGVPASGWPLQPIPIRPDRISLGAPPLPPYVVDIPIHVVITHVTKASPAPCGRPPLRPSLLTLRVRATRIRNHFISVRPIEAVETHPRRRQLLVHILTEVTYAFWSGCSLDRGEYFANKVEQPVLIAVPPVVALSLVDVVF